MTSQKITASLLLLIAATACGSDDEGGPELPEVDCENNPVPTYAEVEVFQQETDLCTQCHYSELSGMQRNNAPSAINVNVYASASQYADMIVKAVYSGRMPPPEDYTITDAQKEQIYLWGLCGTPQ
jgi:uncharacterized membrane protein